MRNKIILINPISSSHSPESESPEVVQTQQVRVRTGVLEYEHLDHLGLKLFVLAVCAKSNVLRLTGRVYREQSDEAKIVSCNHDRVRATRLLEQS